MIEYHWHGGEYRRYHDEPIDDIVLILSEEEKQRQITEVIAEINEHTWSDIQQIIESNISFTSQSEVDMLVEALIEVAEVRPTSQGLILQLINSLSASNPLFEKKLIAKLVHFPRNCEYLSACVLRKNTEALERITRGYISDTAFFWLAPMIEKIDSRAFERKLLSLRARAGDHPRIGAFIAMYKNLRQDDWKLYNEMVNTGVNADSLAFILRFDRLSDLQEIAARGPFDMNQRIEVSPYERCDFVNHKPTLIQYAAFFGATKCFKWLYLNGADLSLCDDPRWNDSVGYEGRSLAEFAVAGGNVEIVRLVEQTGAKFDGCAEIAVQFKWNLIAEWLELTLFK